MNLNVSPSCKCLTTVDNLDRHLYLQDHQVMEMHVVDLDHQEEVPQLKI